MNKTELLQSILDHEHPDHDQVDNLVFFTAEWRGKGGWWIIPSEPRHFADEGVYLGKDIKESLITLKYLGFYEKKET